MLSKRLSCFAVPIFLAGCALPAETQRRGASASGPSRAQVNSLEAEVRELE